MEPWSDRYPDVETLRREVDALAESFVEALLARAPADDVRGIYLKGSARKDWASPVDYVPELSDVDIHIFFREAADGRRRLGSASLGLEVQAEVEQAYLRKIASPVHFPRPQLVVLNDLLEQPGCVLSPRETVTTLYGEDYPEDAGRSEAALREIDRTNLLAQTPYLEGFPLHVIDKPGPHILMALRAMNWRVSPVGPRVLTVLGVPARRAWPLKRSDIIPLLREMGQSQLADDYRDYYLAGWEHFLSGYRDSDAGRRAAAAGVRALEAGLEIAQQAAPEGEGPTAAGRP